MDEIKIANQKKCEGLVNNAKTNEKENGAQKSKRGLLMLNGKEKQQNQWYWVM